MQNVQLDGSDGRPRRYTGMVDCARQIMRGSGVGGLYRGLSAQLCKAVPVAATGFVAYDTMRGQLGLHVVPETFRGARLAHIGPEAGR